MTAHDTFLKLFLDHQTEIRAFVGTLVSDGTRREDVFQEIALTLWKEFDKFDQARSFGAWARGVAANKILQAKRKDRRFPMPFSPEVVEHLLETFASSETSIPSLRERGLRHCRAKLPEKSGSYWIGTTNMARPAQASRKTANVRWMLSIKPFPASVGS